MSDENEEPVRPASSSRIAQRVPRTAGSWESCAESAGRRPAPGVSVPETRAAAVSQAVQGHATNGDEAVRVPVTRVARSSRCGSCSAGAGPPESAVDGKDGKG